jgi:hypothetical protein
LQKIKVGLRREYSEDKLEGHLFWKDGLGWTNWTFHYVDPSQTSQTSNKNLTIYRSANVIGMVDHLESAASNCIRNINSWPDSNY